MTRPKINLKIKDVKDIENIEAVHQSDVVKSGNGAVIKSYKKYIGKDVIAIILSDDPRQKRKISKKVLNARNKEFKNEFND